MASTEFRYDFMTKKQTYQAISHILRKNIRHATLRPSVVLQGTFKKMLVLPLKPWQNRCYKYISDAPSKMGIDC